MTPAIIIGVQGRMGRAIVSYAKNYSVNIVAGIAQSTINEGALPIYKELNQALLSFGKDKPVIVDFSHAESLAHHAALAVDFSCPLLIGTTGHKEHHHTLLKNASHTIPVLVAPNTSLMAVLMQQLAHMAAQVLPACDKGIVDIHHKHKKDAPSGTALALAKVMGDAVSMQSLRLGEVVGDHTAYFVQDSERLEITHRVMDRKVFAQGALYATQFIFNKAPGLYDMNDVLNLKLPV